MWQCNNLLSEGCKAVLAGLFKLSEVLENEFEDTLEALDVVLHSENAV